MAAAVEERSSDYMVKRRRDHGAPSFVCPSDVLINGHVSERIIHSPTALVAVCPPSPLHIEDDRVPPTFERDLYQSGCIVPHDHVDSLVLTQLDDGGDTDAIFRQYLRSPSSSPSLSVSPDHAGSGSSCGTPVHSPHGPYHDISQLDVDSLYVPTREHSPASQVAEDATNSPRLSNGIRIHLRVSQPKLTLRLRLPTRSHRGETKQKQAGKRKSDVKSRARKET